MTILIKRARVCRYCPEGTGIIWNDNDAIRTFEGDLKCLKSVETDTRKMMIRVFGADHPKNKDFLQIEQKKVVQWNNYAQSMNDLNKRMGGKKNILELRRNPYLS
jgi:hypothetical protein